MTVSVNGTTGITFNDASTQNTAATGFGFKNRLMNGQMVIDQRNNGASVTVNNTNLNYSVDRWWGSGKTSDGVYTMQRSASTPPVGFSNFLRVTVTTADASIAAGDTYYMGTKIEGFNVADLGFGSANAQTITISFWARSSVTGTFSGALLNGAENRSYPFTFAITAANTWEYETITIVGDTTGTWATDNSAGMVLTFDLGNGSNWRAAAGSWVAAGEYGATGAVTLISTLNATLDITGVQLEKGSTATSFDYRPYGTELALCQRYFQIAYGASGFNGLVARMNATSGGQGVPLNVFNKVTMRASPTGSIIGTWTTNNCTGVTIVGTSPDVAFIYANATNTGDANFYPNSASNGYSLSAEL